MRYYIADPHFFHGNLNTKMDRRGFADAEEMNGYMQQIGVMWKDWVGLIIFCIDNIP